MLTSVLSILGVRYYDYILRHVVLSIFQCHGQLSQGNIKKSYNLHGFCLVSKFNYITNLVFIGKSIISPIVINVIRDLVSFD